MGDAPSAGSQAGRPAPPVAHIQGIDFRVGLKQQYPDPKDQEATRNTTVDVVALHGLRAESPKTWIAWKDGESAASGEVNWLRDSEMLPNKIPSARILTYDWNADYVGNDASQDRLLGHANVLLNSLLANSMPDTPCKRPLVFIASCFGGLLLAKALVRAADEYHPRSNEFRQILDRTAGVVFLGTPFRGSWKQGYYLAKYRYDEHEKQGHGCSPELIQYLRPDRRDDEGRGPSPLNEMVHRFAEVAQRRGLKIVCFYETIKTPIRPHLRGLPADKMKIKTSGLEIVVPEEAACLDGVERYGLGVRHNMLHKHPSPDGKPFKDIADQVGRLVSRALRLAPFQGGTSDSRESISQFLSTRETNLAPFTPHRPDDGLSITQSDLMELSEMEESDALHLLREALSQTQLPGDNTLAVELLRELQQTPVAIKQAAAHLHQNPDLSLPDYMDLLRGTERSKVRLISSEFQTKTRYQGGLIATRYRESLEAVATAWLASFDQIKKINMAAVELVAFLSCIEPKAIPRSLLPNPETSETENAIRTLCDYAFLTVREDGDTYDMHYLVHSATSVWIRKGMRLKQTTPKALQHIAAVFSSPEPPHRQGWQAYLPHALRLLKSETYRTDEWYNLAHRVAKCLSAYRRHEEAVQYYEQVMRWRDGDLWMEDEKRLASAFELAGAYLESRQLREATLVLEHVVSVQKRTHNEEDPVRLWPEHELGRAYQEQGRLEDAIKILRHVVAVRTKTLSEEHPARLWSEHELARAYLYNKRVSEATEILEKVRAIRARTLDERNDDRLTSEHELAYAYQLGDKLPEAIRLFEHVVATRRQTLAASDKCRTTSERMLDDARKLLNR